MPQTSPSQTKAKDIRRGVPRTEAKFTAMVTCRMNMSSGIVKDLSASGICFQLKFDIQAKAGDPVSIKSEEFGFLTGKVQWNRSNRIGIKLDRSSNTDAQISSYFKFFR